MGDIIFTREDQELYNNLDYEIYINGELNNTIKNGSRKVVTLKAGKYDIFVKVMGAKSPVKQVEIKERQTLRLTCGSSLTGLKYVFSWLFTYSKNNIFLEYTK